MLNRRPWRVQHSIMTNVTWRRFDQSAKQLVVGHTTTAVHIGVGDACSVVLVRCGRGFAVAESGRHSWRDQWARRRRRIHLCTVVMAQSYWLWDSRHTGFDVQKDARHTGRWNGRGRRSLVAAGRGIKEFFLTDWMSLLSHLTNRRWNYMYNA